MTISEPELIAFSVGFCSAIMLVLAFMIMYAALSYLKSHKRRRRRLRQKCPLCGKKMIDLIKEDQKTPEGKKFVIKTNKKLLHGWVFTCPNKKCHYFNRRIVEGFDTGEL